MAVFGFQLCFTIIMASFLQKLTPIYSFGRWILCGGSLVRYLHPSNEELKKFCNKDAPDKKNNKANVKRRQQNNKGTQEKKPAKKEEVFKIPKSAPITLDASEIDRIDTIVLKKYDDFEWLVDYSLYATVVYIVTELYYEWWKPSPEFNISMVWATLAIGFVCKNLISIMRMYFKSETGELSICITFGCFSFVMAMGTLVVDESVLEFGLNSAYKSFLQNASLLSISGNQTVTPVSLPAIKMSVALVSGVIGTLIAFPGIRTAQMYVDGLKYSRGNQLIQLLLHINYATPFLICFMWVKPLMRDVLCSTDETTSKGLTQNQFDILRLSVVVFLCLLKLVAIRTHLQAYLNVAYTKIRNMRKEAGNTTNVEIQRMVASIFYYLCIVALQYVGPVVLVLFLTMALKTLGGHSWQQFGAGFVPTDSNIQGYDSSQSDLSDDATFKEMVSHVGVSLSRLSAVFTPLVFRGVLSFLLWWVCASWFVASCMGIVYHRFLTF